MTDSENTRKRRRRRISSPNDEAIASLVSQSPNPSFREEKRRRRLPSDREQPVTASALWAEINFAVDEERITSGEISTGLAQNDIDQIRAELLQELSYPVADFEYSDGSHDWSDDSEFFSRDYWHFLGRFE